jgi:hypothetical protein
MPATKRQQIIDALTVRMQGILVSGGFHTDAGLHVFVFKSTIWAAEEMPGICIRDVKDLVDGTATTGFDFHHLRVELEFAVAAGAGSDVSARQIVADIYKALGVPDDKFGSLADGIFLLPDQAGDEFKIEQEERIVAGGYVDFVIQFRTAHYLEA